MAGTAPGPFPYNLVDELRASILELVRSLRHTNAATRVLIAVVAVPLLLNAVLLAGYLGSTSQRSSLQAELAEVERKIAQRSGVPGPAGNFADIVLPKEMESADLMDMLLRVSRDSAVELVSVDSLGGTNQRVDGKDYQAFRYRVQVRARVSQLVAFLNRLEQGQQTVLLVNNLAGSPKNGQSWVMAVELVTYVADKAYP